MKAIAIFIENYNIDYSPSIINLLDFLSDRCRVDLFFRNVPMKSNTVLRKKNIRLIEVKRFFHWQGALASARLRLASAMRGHWREAFLPTLLPQTVSKSFSGRNYHGHIAFDPSGMALCKELFPLAKPYHYSLEVTLSSETAPGGEASSNDSLPVKTRDWSRDIRGLIIQSPEREQLFRMDHPLGPDTKVLYLPVTCQGPAPSERRDVLQRRYGIPPQARIAIHLGGVNPYFSSLEIAEVFAALPDWYLFFQGNHLRGYGEEIRTLAKRTGARNIIVSKKFFTHLNDVDGYLLSADVGIAWYNDLNANFRSAGFSSGKISAYMRCGLPVLANDLPSMQAMIARKGCGLCVERVGQIPAALQKIVENYRTYRGQVLREYESRYRFENYHRSIQEFLAL
jgi:glycosyltransferase involved in cell wall biosynthesis